MSYGAKEEVLMRYILRGVTFDQAPRVAKKASSLIRLR